MRTRLYRIIDATRTLGFKRLLVLGPVWLLRREYLVLVKDLGLPLPDVPPHEPMKWMAFTEAEIPRMLALNPGLSETEIRRRWEEGQECQLCWIGESLAHYRWQTHRATFLPQLGKTLRLQQGDIHVTSVFTAPLFRGQGINTISSIMALHRARDLGFLRSITIVAWWNTPALRVNLEKIGYTVTGTLGYWNAGLGRYYSATGAVCLDRDTSFRVQPQVSRHPTAAHSRWTKGFFRGML